MTTTGDIADVLFKDYLNVPFNKKGNPFFNEDAAFSSYSIGDEVLIDPIPRAPVFTEAVCPYSGLTQGSSFSKYEQDSTGVLERFERLKLTQVDLISGGSQAVRFMIGDPPLNLLSDALQFNYGESSSTDYVLFVNNVIVARSNASFGYIFNFRAGYLTFYGSSIPTQAQFTGGNVEFTFVRYRGRKAISQILPATNGLVVRTGAGAVAARSIDVSGNGISITNSDGVDGNPLIEFTGGGGSGIPEFGETIAIGEGAGAIEQSAFGVAVGISAGTSSQGKNAVAVGVSAGGFSQGESSTAIGDQAGQVQQAPGATSIGQYAGRFLQQDNSIAIGLSAGSGFDGGLAWTDGSGASESSWESVTFAPQLNNGRGRIVSVASSGPDRVMYSDDGGENWTIVGGVAQFEWRSVTWAPELNGGSGRLIAVASSGNERVMYSDDGGSTWTTVSVLENEWRCIIWVSELNNNAGRLIALASSGAQRVMYSNDGGTQWITDAVYANGGVPIAIPENGWTSVAWVPPNFKAPDGRLVAVAFSGTERRVMSSDNGGQLWQNIQSPSPLDWRNIIYVPPNSNINLPRGRLIIVASSGTNRVLINNDSGLGAWTSIGSGGGVASIEWTSLAWLPGVMGEIRIVAVAKDGSNRVMVSENYGSSWSVANYNTGVLSKSWQSIVSAPKARGGRDVFVAVASSGSNPTMVGESAASILGPGAAQGGLGDSCIAMGAGASRFGGHGSSHAIAIGTFAGEGSRGASQGQGDYSIAIGYRAGRINQQTNSIAIGPETASESQGSRSIAIGFTAGSVNQGSESIAIGQFAGIINQPNNTIILSALPAGVSGVPGQSNRFYVAPIREQAEANTLRYNPTTHEITHAASGIVFVGGSVGIGTSTPTASSALDVSGNVTVTGNISATGDVTGFSDIALKRNVEPISHALDMVMAMRPVYYEMKTDGRRRVGFVAQEMEQAVPEAVISQPGTWKSIAYGNLTSPIVGALQEIASRLDAVEQRLARLERGGIE